MNDVLENLLHLQRLEMETKRLSSESKLEVHTLREKIPAPIVAHYDRFRARSKKGLAFVRNGVCSECHMKVPVGVFATLLHGDDIQLCSSCGRYLYLPDDADLSELSASLGRTAEKKDRRAHSPAHAHH